MAIRGDLLSADLSNVFQMLALNRKRGRLRVQDQNNFLAQRRLYISEDRVALDERPRERSVLGLLVEMGVISYDDFKSATTRARRYHTDATNLLRQQAKISLEQLEEAQRRRQEEEILEVFLWRNVSFRLEEGAADPACPHSFSVDSLIIEAARRQDEWRHLSDTQGSGRRIFAPTGAELSIASGADAVQLMVLDCVDGIRGSREIMEETGLSRYHVDVSLWQLAQRGVVESLGLSDLISRGDVLVESGNVEDGIRLFRAAMSFNRQHLQLHRRLATAWLKIGRIAKSAAHYRFCATSLLASGNHQEAITIFANVLKILPTDFRTVERCSALIAEVGGDLSSEAWEVIAQGSRLLGFYQETKQDAAALTLAKNLFAARPSDDALLLAVARLSMRLNERESAIEHYRALAERKTEANDIAGALEIYRTLAGFDAVNRHLYEGRAADLNRDNDRRERRGKRKKAIGVVLSIITVVCLVGTGYAVLADRDFKRLSVAVPIDLATAERAADTYRKFARKWPLTPAAGKAAELAQAAQNRLSSLALDAKRKAEKTRAGLNDIEDRIQRMLAEGRGLTLAKPSRITEAREVFMKAADIAKTLPGSSMLRAEATKMAEDTARYLLEGQSLISSAADALARGDVALAFQSRLRACTDFALLPEVAALELPLIIETIPAGADVAVPELGVKGVGPLTVLVPARLPKVQVKISGRDGKERRIDVAMPPERCEVVIAVEQRPRPLASLGEEVNALLAIDRRRIAALTSRGTVAFLDVESGGAVRGSRRELQTVTTPPVAVQGGIVVLSSQGEARFESPDGATTKWKVPLIPKNARKPRLWPTVGNDHVLMPGGDNEVVLLNANDGTSAWRAILPASARSAAVGPYRVALILDDASLALLDRATGKVLGRRPGPWRGTPLVISNGFVLWRDGVGFVVVGDEGDGRVSLPYADELRAGPVTAAGVAVVAVRSPELLIHDGTVIDRVRLPSPCKRLRVDGDRFVLAALESGEVVVVDVSSRKLLGGAMLPTVSLDAMAATSVGLVASSRDGVLSVYPWN